MKFPHIFLPILFLSIVSCKNQEKAVDVVGNWIEPVPGMPNLQQGIKIERNGKASSINMATLHYENWKQDHSKIILGGKSIGNHQTIDFKDTLEIVKSSPDSLVLKNGSNIIRYSKISDDQLKNLSKASINKEVKKVKGTVILGDEVRSFKPNGDTNTYWIIDNTNSLEKQYNTITKGVKNGKPVEIEMDIIDKGATKDGFAKSYTSVYSIEKIYSIKAK